MKCCICKNKIKSENRVKGHNAEPVCKGKCCDFCNTSKVIPARLKDSRTETENDME